MHEAKQKSVSTSRHGRTGLELSSLFRQGSEMKSSFVSRATPDSGLHEVVMRVEATLANLFRLEPAAGSSDVGSPGQSSLSTTHRRHRRLLRKKEARKIPFSDDCQLQAATYYASANTY
ncbi:hypothetical protein LJR296_008050 [Cupriavidus necator]|uniref:hypothetical protein n=1 Tax=Cupriavidus necator TaxID=106590 RepID=UPI003ECCBB16